MPNLDELFLKYKFYGDTTVRVLADDLSDK